MKSTTTARMPETTLIRVTLSISSPQRGLAPLALQFNNSRGLAFGQCMAELLSPGSASSYSTLLLACPNSEQDVNRGSRTVTREILHRFALASYCAAEIFQVSCLGSSILEIALFGTGADNLWSLSKKPRCEFAG